MFHDFFTTPLFDTATKRLARNHDPKKEFLSMKIEVLYFDGCPSWQTGVDNLQQELRLEGLAWPVELTAVRDDDQAARLQFLGSPSFRVGDQDLWPEERAEYSMSCRVYRTPEGVKGWPSVDMLRERLRQRVTELSLRAP